MTDEERELSALLERAVPQLPAPAQRLERVRERMRRRRRRRAAVAASATAVVLVAAAGLLLAGPAGTSTMPGRSTQAASGSAGSGTARQGPSVGVSGSAVATTAAGSATVSQSPTPPGSPAAMVPPGYRVYSFADLTGLWLVLPAGWHTLVAAKGSGYVSTQALGLPKDQCVHAREALCTPLVRTLDHGGSLVQFTGEHSKERADKARLLGRTIGPEPAEATCRAVGGTVQLAAELTGPVGSDALIEATACLSHPTAAQQAQIRHVLMTAGFQ